MEVGTLNTMFKAYAPAEMAKRIAAYGIRKVQLDMAFNGRGYDVDELTPDSVPASAFPDMLDRADSSARCFRSRVDSGIIILWLIV